MYICIWGAFQNSKQRTVSFQMYAERVTDSHFVYICIYILRNSVCLEIMRGFSI